MLIKLFTIFTTLLLGANCQTQSSPSMVYMLNRHGISPCIDPPLKESGSQLFDSSYERNYIKGQKVRQIYPVLSPGYKYNEVHFNASAWQRTIATAHGMIHGLFPSLKNNSASVPVFTNSWARQQFIVSTKTCTFLVDFIFDLKLYCVYFSNLNL